MGKILKNPFHSSAWVTVFPLRTCFVFTKFKLNTEHVVSHGVWCWCSVFCQEKIEQPADSSEKLHAEEPKAKKQVWAVPLYHDLMGYMTGRTCLPTLVSSEHMMGLQPGTVPPDWHWPLEARHIRLQLCFN